MRGLSKGLEIPMIIGICCVEMLLDFRYDCMERGVCVWWNQKVCDVVGYRANNFTNEVVFLLVIYLYVLSRCR